MRPFAAAVLVAAVVVVGCSKDHVDDDIHKGDTRYASPNGEFEVLVGPEWTLQYDKGTTLEWKDLGPNGEKYGTLRVEYLSGGNFDDLVADTDRRAGTFKMTPTRQNVAICKTYLPGVMIQGETVNPSGVEVVFMKYIVRGSGTNLYTLEYLGSSDSVPWLCVMDSLSPPRK